MKVFDMDGKIKLLCLIYFMVAQCSMMARATSDSFLLKYFEVESIPLMIMAAASLSIVLAIFTTYLCGRFQAYGAMKIATAGLVFILGVVIAFVFLLGKHGEVKAVYVFAYMICEVIVILPMVLFWGMAVGVLNPTESKKWMGMIGAAGTCGCILAGYTISWVSKEFYVNELSLGLVAAMLLVVSFILMARSKLLTIEDDCLAPTQNSSIFSKLAVLISSRQSMLMTGLVVFSAIVMSLIDINFKFEVRGSFADKPPGELYDFFGRFYTYSSIAQLILQLLVVRAILTRGGVWGAISILPIFLLITSVFALVTNWNGVYVSKFITQVVFFTLEYVGLQMLFLSVTKKMRGQMNSAVDGLTRPATIAAISLLITSTLPFWREDSVFRLNSIIVCLCLVWLFVSFLNYKEYLSSLIKNLGAGRLLMCRSIPKNPASNSSGVDAKKNFEQKLSGALLTHHIIASLGEESRFRPLRQALENELERNVEHMTFLLFELDEKVNFHKLIHLVKFAKAGVKSEALEVFKGVLGPKRTDEFVSLFQPCQSDKKETVVFKDLIRSIGEYDCRWILSGLLLIFSLDEYHENEDFVSKCLRHADDLVRETALQVYLRHEADAKGVDETCLKFSEDTSPRISQLAQDKLALS
jgi:ATP/ADP translocase